MSASRSVGQLIKATERRIDLVGSIPFVGVHIAALWAIWLPFGWTEVALCFGLYFIRPATAPASMARRSVENWIRDGV